MTKRILFANYHAPEEAASVALYHSLGYEVISLGAYLDPANPGDPKRPPLDVPMGPPEVVEACRDTHAAKQFFPDVVFEWLGHDGIIIYHHFMPQLFSQWPRIHQWRKGSTSKRVIWRSDGQSSADLERTAQFYRGQGLERVSYSPKEANLPHYAGHDAVIRMGFDPDEWTDWHGDAEIVTNVTQHLAQRGSATNYGFWQQAIESLPHVALGPGSEEIGGQGELSFSDMKWWLRNARAYLYTGTQPASYTMGLIEAAMTGIPVVSIGPGWMNQPELFEAPELVPLGGFDDPEMAKGVLRYLLNDHDAAKKVSQEQRAFMVANFSNEVVGKQWADYLG